MRLDWGWVTALSCLLLGACGSRSVVDLFDASTSPDVLTAEACDGLDNDGDNLVDEAFRDTLGRYTDDAHCGACNNACTGPIANATEVGCGLVFESPLCVAERCAPGFGPTFNGTCAPLNGHLCLSCLQDNECGDLLARSCAPIAGEQRCSLRCDADNPCPDDYVCDPEDMTCVPTGGSCTCVPGVSFTVACVIDDPEGEGQCTGLARCEDGVFSGCEVEEICDEQDNDCDSEIDETFRNAVGAYAIDERHCGMCGVDCNASEVPGVELKCGGDAFTPSCVLDCPDERDGRMAGDHIDGDGVIGNGCECMFTRDDDVPGPVGTEGEALDVNCDGADGIVIQSLYVAPDGDDDGPGSPTRPLRTVVAAIDRATESLSSRTPRPDIFVAAGSYVERVRIPDGVRIHGGYRRDFRALDPAGFRVVLLAPSDTDAPAGAAAVIAAGAGATETVIEWVELRGRDASTPESAAVGLWIESPGGDQLFVRQARVRSGLPGDGTHGMSGMAGRSPTTTAGNGSPQRVAIEDSARQCIASTANTVSGGTGGRNSCDSIAVHGGNGGSPGCPLSGRQPAGQNGQSMFGLGGLGGDGGDDLDGPNTMTCPNGAAVCCGLADFNVPGDFRFPQAGTNGSNGDNGTTGERCTDALGRFVNRQWRGANATSGTAGQPGSGGGGGGGGGSLLFAFSPPVCGFADGLGGSGGGGGAGGCGGRGGTRGTSGGPAIGIVIEGNALSVHVQDVTIETSRGGRGGDGGVGGEGALGGAGGLGGALAREQQSTPSTAGPVGGARGGRGGNGGAGGGGGGGCGGASVGIWLLSNNSTAATALRTANTFALGEGGNGGRGGGGAVPAAAGQDGGAFDVIAVP